MSARHSTAGIKFGYAVETTAGTRPTAGYTYISELKSIPDNNPEPEQLETTTLDETISKTYISGLKDPGGSLTFTANFTEDFKTQWEALVTAYETAKVSDKATWFVVIFPGITETAYFQGSPSAIGLPGAEVNEVQEVDVYVSPESEVKWAAAPQ